MNNWSQVVCRTAVTLCVGAAAEAWWKRPLIDTEHRDGKTSHRVGWISIYSQTDKAGQPISFLMHIAQHISIGIVALSGRLFTTQLGKFHIHRDENYFHLIDTIRSRPSSTPLITIANHRAIVDDFFLFGSIMPLWMTLRPKYQRWSICSQEICFEKGMFFATYSGAGKSLPIVRGGGINQKLLCDFSRLAAAGQWLHVFPEAGCFQHEILGGRYNFHNERAGKGRLKWGVAKLIAHAPNTPIVIPFYHSGMERIMPQHEYPRALINKYPQPGHDVSVKVGYELHFDDLIASHESKYGKLWKYSVLTEDQERRESFHEYWDSKATDLILYNKIMDRIEASLLALGEDMPHYGKVR